MNPTTTLKNLHEVVSFIHTRRQNNRTTTPSDIANHFHLESHHVVEICNYLRSHSFVRQALGGTVSSSGAILHLTHKANSYIQGYRQLYSADLSFLP